MKTGGVVPATITFGKELDTACLFVLGEAVFSLVTLSIVMFKTVHKAWNGALFPAPGKKRQKRAKAWAKPKSGS